MRKKIFTAGAALLATVFIGQTVSARTLEDILKEKGVITAEDYKEVTKAKPISYKVGKGFAFTSQDEKFQLLLGARFQGRYSFLDKDSGSQDVSEWKIRRMKFWMQGYAYTKDLTYLLQVDMVNSSNDKFVEHAYLDYKMIEEARILIGQTKVPFGRQWLNSSGSQQFVDRSAVSDFFRPGYDMGAKLHGKIAKGLLNYDLGWYGGKGQGVVTSDNNNSMALRVTVDPLGNMAYGEADLDDTSKPLVSIGANYFHDRLAATFTPAKAATATSLATVDTTALAKNNLNIGFLSSISATNGFKTTEKFDIDLGGLDMAAKWRGFFALAEYLVGQAKGDDSDADIRAHGFLTQAGYCIIPQKLEVALRYGYIDPNRDKSGDLRSEVGGAVSYYFNKHNLKIQADAIKLYDEASKTNQDQMQYRAQVQIIF